MLGHTKLQFAREYLTDEAVLGYSHVFLWDGDVALTESFDALRYLATADASGAFLSQPALTWNSTSSYKFHTLPKGGLAAPAAAPRTMPVQFVEVGFMVWTAPAWSAAWHAVLKPYEFRFWCFDLLPFRCIVQRDGVPGPLNVVVVQSDAISHFGGGKTLGIDGHNVRQEDGWHRAIQAQFEGNEKACEPQMQCLAK